MKDLSDTRTHQDITYPSLERSMQEMQNYLIAKCRLLPTAAVCQRM